MVLLDYTSYISITISNLGILKLLSFFYTFLLYAGSNLTLRPLAPILIFEVSDETWVLLGLRVYVINLLIFVCLSRHMKKVIKCHRGNAIMPQLRHEINLQLTFFKGQFKPHTVNECKTIFQTMNPDVRKMFPLVEKLLKLVLISPASSCSAERSFSALRRLKTYLRSTMGQSRLNHVTMCHIHKDQLTKLDPKMIAKSFINQSIDTRTKVFGTINIWKNDRINKETIFVRLHCSMFTSFYFLVHAKDTFPV